MTRLLSNVIKADYIKIKDNKYNLNINPININKEAVDEIKEESPKKKELHKEEKKEIIDPEAIIREATQRADEIINQANEEANQIINQALEDANTKANQIMADAEQNGYNSGYNQAITEVNALKAEIQNQLDATIYEKEETLKAIEPQVIQLVLKISESIFGVMLDINPQLIGLLIRKGLDNTGGIGNMLIHVSKDDYDAASQSKFELSEYSNSETTIEIVKDLSLDRGDCIIETPFGNIDSSFDQQFSTIKQQLIYVAGIR